ncbi:MAG: hypothetical protein K9G44_12635, partial [Melioribacteraceae bacterium]|nr:hypothetical protein [Melioribacteraceae bacterium]
MTKKAKRSKKNISEKRQSKNRFGIEIGEKIPEKYHNIAGLGIIVLALMLFLSPLYFGDKTFQSGDVITQSSYQTFFESSDNTTWNPYIFCGMPMFGSAGWYDIANNLIVEVRTGLTNLFNDRYAGYSFFLLILGFGSFYLMRFKKYSVGISLFTAISTLFSVAIISLLFEGHINRMTTLVCLPFM